MESRKCIVLNRIMDISGKFDFDDFAWAHYSVIWKYKELCRQLVTHGKGGRYLESMDVISNQSISSLNTGEYQSGVNFKKCNLTNFIVERGVHLVNLILQHGEKVIAHCVSHILPCLTLFIPGSRNPGHIYLVLNSSFTLFCKVVLILVNVCQSFTSYD